MDQFVKRNKVSSLVLWNHFNYGHRFFFIPYITKYDSFKELLFSLVIAFIAASILGFAQRLFFYDDFKSEMDGLVSNSLHSFLSQNMFPFLEQGIDKLHVDRQAALHEFINILRLKKTK